MLNDKPVALITGAARRIGAEIARTLHSANFNIVLHYRQSQDEVFQLCEHLNGLRPDSATCLQADLCNLDAIHQLAEKALSQWQRIDALINNASSFYSTAIGEITETHWHDLISTNLKAPLFLSQALAPELSRRQGCIINLADIHGERPLSGHSVYCVAKAGNIMLTKSLAKELAPNVRVNGIAPGTILWPEQGDELDDDTKALILDRIVLEKLGTTADIANTVKFLLTDAPYITGQILAVDGGRALIS